MERCEVTSPHQIRSLWDSAPEGENKLHRGEKEVVRKGYVVTESSSNQAINMYTNKEFWAEANLTAKNLTK